MASSFGRKAVSGLLIAAAVVVLPLIALVRWKP